MVKATALIFKVWHTCFFDQQVPTAIFDYTYSIPQKMPFVKFIYELNIFGKVKKTAAW